MIEYVNQMPSEECRVHLHRCCASDSWVKQMEVARPFSSADQMHQKAIEIWNGLTESDFLEAFEGHPMIGANLDELRKKFTDTSSWSEGEQSGVQSASEDTLVSLQTANIQYFERFGYIFIVCATGKSAGEMLGLLLQRIHNSPDEEILIAAGEQQKITTIRLNKWLSQL